MSTLPWWCPPLLAGLLVIASHVPLGTLVLRRGIVFIDLAIAQIAALGVVVAGLLGWAEHPWLTQSMALSAAGLGAALLAWLDRRWPEVQEAQIGVVFALAATAGILLLAHNPHGDAHLKDLLAGQILWVGWADLLWPALVSVVVLGVLGYRRLQLGGLVFYLTFALAVTVSVQLVGVYLVFATLIVPALASRLLCGLRRWVLAYGLAVLAYASGLWISGLWDMPTGAVIVWLLALLGMFASPMMVFANSKNK